MKPILVLISLFSFICCKSQILDSLSVLESYVISRNGAVLEADLHVHKESNKYNYLFFVPNVGYDFVWGRPMVTYNFTQLATFLKAKQVSKRKAYSINKTSSLSLESSIAKLRSFYSYCNILFSRLYDDIEVYNINKQLFEIKEQEYNNDEITLENYLKSKISIAEKKQSINALKDRIVMHVFKIEELTNKQLNYFFPKY